MIDLIIVSYNNKALTVQAIESAMNNSEPPQKIVVVDNNSTDGTVSFLKLNYPQVHLVPLQENTGYGKAVNIAFSQTNSPFVLISNNDVIFPQTFFMQLRRVIEELNGNFGAIGFQQIYPNGRYQNSYGKFHTLLGAIADVFFVSIVMSRIKKVFWKLGCRRVKQVDYVDGAVICVNRQAFERVSGFDEDFFFYSEEVDLCKRLSNLGYKIYFDSKNLVIHYRGQGVNNRIGLSSNYVPTFVNSRYLYCKKHLSTFERKLYMLLEALFYIEISFIWKMISFFGGKDYSEIIKLTKGISKQFYIHSKFS